MNILLVEDNFVDLKVLLMVLHKAYTDVETYVTQNEQEAVKYLNHKGEYVLEEFYPIPDLIIMNGEMTRLEKSRLLKEKAKNSEISSIPLLVLLKNPDESKVEGLNGVNGYIAKDFEGNELITEINKLLKLEQ